MTNEELDAYVFNDPELDNLKDFDYLARAALIEGHINKQEYLSIERIRQAIYAEIYVKTPNPAGRSTYEDNENFSDDATDILRDVLAGV